MDNKVKIAALSPEFSAGEKRGDLEQGRGEGEAPLGGLAAAEEEEDGPLVWGWAPRGGRLGAGPGSDSPDPSPPETKKVSELVDAVAESPGDVIAANWSGHPFQSPDPERPQSLERTTEFTLLNVFMLFQIRGNPIFDTCERKIEFMERYPKWRNVQKTLHWLNRLLSSNHSSMKICVKRRTAARKPAKDEFHLSKAGEFNIVPHRRVSRLKLKRGEEKKVKRKRKYKHKSWRSGREKLKSQRKEFRYENNASAILKPNSVLFDGGEMFLKRANDRKAGTRECLRANWSSRSSGVEGGKKCEGKRKNSETSQEFERKSMHSAEGWSGGGDARGRGPDSKLPQQKPKPWPHFVYHRVSSNSLHPEPAGHSHRQSAYVAISVATSTKPETTDNSSQNAG